ncbi:aliphatic sulfonate ABC transporter substrate-binding protein [Rossellomorea marisflavi]|uniref:aliphatic sulfonate ABC transporter substrate-binding protein n=1 Tax=Rossellomorea marisflavi TaxID=189381 RepID=UPI00285340B3|nr:aliphatic sulfonate ABC transporter substrate-binding protein [Rossellomorea marisflavi]MDR4938853.1 aliphatic sulfonate ABC transporter substrate-binding protein [Rossellomorea marisflavi]
MKKYSVIAIMISIFLLLAGCSGLSSSAEKKDSKVIKIGYQKGNTINILKESGFLEEALKEEGYKVEWKLFTHGGTLLEGIYSSAIDFGHAADGSGIFAQASGKPLVYVGADAPNPEGVGLMVRTDSGINSIEELKGKKVGVLKGGNHHYLAILALESVGLTADDVQWVYPEDAAQGRSLIETKQVDALASYDPFFAGIETELDVKTLTENIDYDYPNRTFYYSTPEFAEDHPELVDTIIKAIDKSDQWANDNKDEVTDLLSKALGIDENIISKAVERRTYGATGITQEIIDAQQRQADKYYEIGLIPKELDVSKDMPIK